MSTYFVFCYPIARRRTDPVEDQLTRVTVLKRGLAAIQTVFSCVSVSVLVLG